jgi:hypothetical protein
LTKEINQLEFDKLETRSHPEVTELSKPLQSERNTRVTKPLLTPSPAPYSLTKKIGPKKPIISAGFPEV